MDCLERCAVSITRIARDECVNVVEALFETVSIVAVLPVVSVLMVHLAREPLILARRQHHEDDHHDEARLRNALHQRAERARATLRHQIEVDYVDKRVHCANQAIVCKLIGLLTGWQIGSLLIGYLCLLRRS